MTNQKQNNEFDDEVSTVLKTVDWFVNRTVRYAPRFDGLAAIHSLLALAASYVPAETPCPKLAFSDGGMSCGSFVNVEGYNKSTDTTLPWNVYMAVYRIICRLECVMLPAVAIEHYPAFADVMSSIRAIMAGELVRHNERIESDTTLIDVIKFCRPSTAREAFEAFQSAREEVERYLQCLGTF